MSNRRPPSPSRRPASPYGTSPYASPYGSSPYGSPPYGSSSHSGPSHGGPGRKTPAGGGPKRPTTQALNVLLLLVTLVAGALFGWLLERLYNAVLDDWARPLLIGTLFGLFALGLTLVVFALSAMTRTFEDNVVTNGGGKGSAFLCAILVCLLVFGLGALFQWLYSLDFVAGAGEPTSFVFVIDDSASMGGNDPDNRRYDAIEDVLEEKDDKFPYMVYSFGQNVAVTRDMAPKNVSGVAASDVDGSDTRIRAALTQVINDYESGLWEGGKAPRVILFTDGEASDMFGGGSGVNDLLRRYVSDGITVSTVGLGDVDELLLERIAEGTGGIFVGIERADELSEALSHASFEATRRDLVSTRSACRLPGLYAVLRVLFLTGLGFLIGVCATVSCGQPNSIKMTLIWSAATAFLGALTMEVGALLLDGWHDSLLRMIMWVLLALTVSAKSVFRRPSNVSGRNLSY